MDAIALHTELRNALALSDELGRHEHAAGQHQLAGQLAALRTTLAELERESGQTHHFVPVASPTLVSQLDHCLEVLRDHAEEIPVQLRPRVGLLMDAVERIVFAERQPASSIPSKPVLGVLPLARVVPQDVHSIGDYLVSAAYLASALVARTRRGRAMGLLLGCGVAGVSMTTDYRLSLMKVLPIETHEVLDHVSGIQAASAPFALGYVKKDPIASAIQIVAGLGTIALSLFTDYRADRGVTYSRRSKGGPKPHRDRLPKDVHNRVPEIQRPLEGLAGPSYLPSLATGE